jgi:cytochrome c553
MKALAAICAVIAAAPVLAEEAELARARKIVAGTCFLCHGMQGGAATEVAACVGCHGERGHGSAQLPRLAGQVPSYLAVQMRNFGARMRTNDNAVMHTIAEKMTDDEIRAVAEYLSGLD